MLTRRDSRSLRWALVPVLVLMMALAACTGATPAAEMETQEDPARTSAMPDGAVSGTVTYLQRSALAPGSVVTVQLQDVSRMDAPAQILSEQVITTAGEQPPFAFQLPYSNAQFDESARLVVRATIDDPEGNLIFTSDTVTPVITNGAPTENVEIVVVPVGGGAAAAPDAAVTGTVTYLPRIALAPGSVVTVQIQDISRQDVAAEIIGEQVITTTGEQVPLPFEVPYSTAGIMDNRTYALQARIESADGQLLFINDTITPVITNGAPTSDVEVLVVPVSAGPAAPDAGVTGTVTYLQRSALVPGSVVTVQLQDVSRMDVAAEIIGEQVITTTGEQVPIPFEVPYSTSDIIDGHTYALQARIESPEGQLLFINDTFTEVISNGAPTEGIEMVLVQVGGGGEAASDAAVTGTVTYLQRIALAPGSVIVVQLRDVSRMDVSAEIIGEQVIVIADEQVPVAFEVPYASSQIVDNHRYAVRATIEDPEGNLIFTSDTVIPVITNGAPTENIEIVVVPVG